MTGNAGVPLIFVRVRSRGRLAGEVRRSRMAAEQMAVIAQWASGAECTLMAPVIIAVTRAPWHPARDARLTEAIRAALTDKCPLLMDDVLRVADGCDDEDAFRIVRSLIGLGAPIHSIRHGRLLPRIDVTTINREVTLRVAAWRVRSERARHAAAAPDQLQPAPSAAARRAALQVRTRQADRQARHLAGEIARIQAGLPDGEQTNCSALARALNAAGVSTPSGRGKWQGTTVTRVLARAGQLPER